MTQPTQHTDSGDQRASDQGDALSVWTYAIILLRHIRVVVALPIIAAVLVVAVSLSTPREYTASATLVPQEPGAPSSGLGFLASQFGLATGAASVSSPQFYADLLRSDMLVKDVVTSAYPAAGGKTLLDYFVPDADTTVRSLIKAMARFQSRYTVRVDRVTGVIAATVSTRNPALSAQVLRRILDLLNDFNLRRRQSQARAEREFVEQRLDTARATLAGAENALTEFYLHNRRPADSPLLMAEEGRLQRQVQLRQQVFLTLSQSFETAKIEEVRNTPVVTVIGQPETLIVPRSRGTLGKAFVGLILGGLAGLAYAFLREYFQRERHREPQDYAQVVRLARASLQRIQPRQR